MPFFIKTEQFNKNATCLSPEKRNVYLAQHKSWINALQLSGKKIKSGYLANKEKEPGGGGLLVIEANNFEEAKLIIEEDPMIKNNLVSWKLQEWIPVTGNLWS